MFEAKLSQSATLRKILDAIKDLVTEACWDCTPQNMSLQAMDTSHVSLVTVNLKSEGFDKYRCDRNTNLGMNLGSLAKILKCANNDDTVTLKATDDADKLCMTFEAKDESEVAEYELKLMNLDSEYLGIPDTEYSVHITMPSNKFQRICRDMSQIGDVVTISAAKGDVRFAASGDMGTANVRLNQSTSADKPSQAVKVDVKDPICQAFATKYLNHFAKATPLSSTVNLSLAPDVPLVVEYLVQDEDEDEAEIGHVRYYLAPKIDEENE